MAALFIFEILFIYLFILAMSADEWSTVFSVQGGKFSPPCSWKEAKKLRNWVSS